MDGPANLSDDLLRRALEFVHDVAAAGQRLRPPLPAPSGLKPYLRFQKLPGTALSAVRKAVEGDDHFRSKLGEVATEEEVGALGYLWLARPLGWEDEAARLVTEAQAGQERDVADREERSALKQLELVQQALARAKAAQVAAEDEVAREREKRQAAEARVRDVVARVDQLDADLAQERRDSRVARDQAAAARRQVDETAAKLRDLQERHTALTARLDEALAARVAAEAASGTRGPSPAVDAAAVSLREAAAAMAKLAGALGETAHALGGDGQWDRGPAPVAAKPRAAARGGRVAPARTPVAIPGGLLKDQPEVVLHLVRVPKVLVVVDGYNVSKTAWPELGLAEQRERLLDAMEDLVRRVNTQVHVVFDGADVAVPPTGRRLLHVTFSPPGVIADDVIRDLVAEVPPERPVLVVTSDNAVVASVRAMGANTVTSAQFLAALAR